MAIGLDRTGRILQSLLAFYVRSSSVLALGALILGVALAYAVSYAVGGSHTSAPHLFYVPIVLGAVRFGWRGAVLSAVAAGLLAGPALPSDVEAHVAQTPQSWLLRLFIFVAVGAFVAWLVRGRHEPMRVELNDTLLSGRLLRAIGRGDIEVFYQPVVRVADQEIIGVEALARWHHPKRGYISPVEFIPAAERTGAVTVLDRYVLLVATRQAQVWATHIRPLTMSVNVSATRFAQRDLAEEVAQVLAKTGLPAEALQLEITESALIHDVEGASAQIGQLRRLGAKVALDDFGAGQASLGYLNYFDVNTVKLDRSLVADIATQPRTSRLVAGFIGLFRSLDLEVVAEGVEDAHQLGPLEAAGCHFVQGYHLGRPASTQMTTDLLLASHGPMKDQRVPDGSRELPAA